MKADSCNLQNIIIAINCNARMHLRFVAAMCLNLIKYCIQSNLDIRSLSNYEKGHYLIIVAFAIDNMRTNIKGKTRLLP